MIRSFLIVIFASLLIGGSVQAAPSPIGTGLQSNIILGALQDPSVVNRNGSANWINYDVDLNSWRYDVYVPPSYDGTKPYGVVVYISSVSPGEVLTKTADDKNLIWIAPRNVQNSADPTDRLGASLLALYRAKELFNIDPRRIYTSGLSGGARAASALAFYQSDLIRGTAPSSGFSLPRLNALTPDYITNKSGQTDSYYDYSSAWFFGEDVATINANAKANKLRSYIITRYDDYRDYYFTEGFHGAYEPQGQTCFLYLGPGTHQDATDSEMEEAIDYLDRDDTFPVNNNITAGAGGFSGMADVSQSGASAVEATSGGNTTYTLTPTLTATAAAKTNSAFYWDNANGSTVRWLWEVKNAAPTNQKTCFGLWFANETWGGGAPVSVTGANNPGILITIIQNGSQNRMIVSARPDSGGEVVFYDGYFSFVQSLATASTNPQTGTLSGTGSPVEIKLDLNKNRWQLTFNGINLDGATNTIASGTQIARDKTNDSDDHRLLFGYWNSAVGGSSFWYHDPYTSASDTWSPYTKAIFTAATGAASGTGTAPSPMELRYVIASDPGLPDPPAPGPTGLAATSSGGAINLTWNAVAGATSYTIQRSSVSGGPYATIQSGITGTSYTDSSVTAGNYYYYTIFATTASGDTAIVPEVAGGAGFQLDAWSGGGADANWQTTANWNTLPAAGDSLNFAGSTQLSNTNNYPVGTSFGGLMFNFGAGAFTLGGNGITLTGDIVSNSSNVQTVNVPVALAAGTHNLTANSGNVAMGGAISGSGKLAIKSSTATVSLAGNNSFTGGTTVTGGGTVIFGNNNAFGTGAVTVNGGTLKASGGYTIPNSFAISGATSLDMSGANTSLNGNLSGASALTLNNSGAASTLTFNGNDSGYSGTLTINNGSAVNFTSANAGSASAAWVFNDANAGRVRVAIGSNTLNLGSLAGSGQFVNNSGNSTAVLSVGGANTTTTFAGTIKDNGTGIFNLLKTGTGILGLSGASAYSGGTTINGGSVGVASANGANTNLGSGAVIVNSGGILRVGYSVTSNQNVSTTANAITLAGGFILADDANQHLSGNVAVSASGGTLGSTYNAGTNSAAEKDKGLALDGIVSGSGALTVQHSRISTGNSYNTSFVAFSNAANTYSGTITINENTTTSEGGVYLGVNGATALRNATIATSAIPGSNLKFGTSPVVFKTGLGSATLGAISGSAPLVLTGYDEVNHAYGTDAIALTAGGNNATTTYSGAISGLGGFTKAGTGVLTLSGASTYAGSTTVNAGTFNITGSLGGGGALTVNSGGALAGTGTVSNATTVANGGAIAPGNNGAGVLTISGGLSLGNGAVLNLDLAGTTTSDKIAVSGAFSASGTTTINLNALGSFAGAGTYPIITGASGISASSFAVGTTPPGYGAILGASNGTLSVTLVAPPAAPTNFTVVMGDGTASLNWTAGSGATSYTVLRSQTSGGSYTAIATGVTSTSYTDTGLDSGTAYYYKVSSDNVAGSTSVDSGMGAVTIPAPPTNLSLTAGDGRVDLSWTASTGATGYKVLRATDAAGPYTEVASNVTSTSYTDTGLDSGTTYYYRIVATNDSGASSDGSPVGATTIPSAPATLSLTAGNGLVDLAWTASAGASSYDVLRATDAAGPYAEVASTVTSTKYTDTGLDSGTTYYYRIVATNDAGTSSDGSAVGATTIPAAPSVLSAAPGDGHVDLAWTASAGATGYKVQRATDAAGPYLEVAANVTATAYTDTGVGNGTTYYYSVVATNDAGASVDSAVVNAMPAAPPAMKVTGKTTIATDKAKITLHGTTSGTVKSVTWKIGRKIFTASGTEVWRANVRLKSGRNVITITALGIDGTTSTKKIVIVRH